METILQNDNFYFLLITLIGFLLLLYQAALLYKILQCKNWNEVKGEVISSKLGVIENTGEVDTSYRAKIEYQYSVNKNTYTSNRIYFGDKLSSSFKSSSISLLNNYPIGQLVTVFYNPLNNKDSVLEQRLSKEVVFMFIIGFLSMIVGLYFLDFSALKQLFLSFKLF